MGKVYFTENMKLADIITANHNLILMLPRFGIPLGFGDKSVLTVCKQNRIPVDFFLMVCNVYTFDHYIPDYKNIISINMDLLIPYLLASHNYYLKERLPHIEKHLYLIAERAGTRYESMLKNFFNEYKNEVSEHFEYEEKTVFPYIESLKNNKPETPYQIKDFREAHSNIEDKLNDLMQIVFKYLPENIEPYESIELVFDIMQLSSDLIKHALIEEKIVVSYVTLLEKKYEK
jgi:regulator of cell morphogenesis and NO signaling